MVYGVYGLWCLWFMVFMVYGVYGVYIYSSILSKRALGNISFVISVKFSIFVIITAGTSLV
jgi:hypothetical protein